MDLTSLKRTARRWIRKGPNPWRAGVQVFFLVLVVAIGIDFYRFVRYFETGGATAWASRPPGVEGFLPISALLSLKYWLATGTVHPVHPAGFVLFLAIVGMSLLLKKAFCSWVCPVGLLSEWLGRLGKLTFGKNLHLPRWLDVPLRGLKYALLAFFLWAILQMPTGAIAAFLDSPYNRVADVKMLKFFTDLTATAGWTLIVLAALSVPIRFFWCRYLCPYGALLGLGSLLSPYKVTRAPVSCTDCGLCARVCPSNIPVDRLLRVRSDECTGCVECVRSCPAPGALSFALPRPIPLPAPARRLSPVRVAVFVMLLFLLPVGAAKVAGLWKSSVTTQEYGRRIMDLGSPIYTHAYGNAPADPGVE